MHYSYCESIMEGIKDVSCLNPLVRAKMIRIPHVFNRRPCVAILEEVADEDA